MKEYKYLYQKMLSEEVIRKAYKKLRKGKTKRKEIIYIDTHLDEEVRKMHDMIENTRPPEVPVEHPELAYRPCKRTPKIIHEHGKTRKIYMPEIHEQWLHHIIVQILEPIIMATAYPYACGSFPKRGAHYGKKRIEKWLRSDPKGTRNFAKIDIRHFYDSIQIDGVLMRELRIRIKDEWLLYVIRLCLKGFKKGIPLGFYISQWLANYMLEPLDKFVTEKLGIKKDLRYMDDMGLFASSKKALHRAIIQIQMFIGRRYRLKLKSNYQVCKFYFEKSGQPPRKGIGRPLDFMGFLFYRSRTIIRKSILISAVRLAKRMDKAKEARRGYYQKHIEAMLSYMGWFSCTDTYRCYEEWIKPYVKVSRLKKIISKLKRRQENHDKLDAGKMCYGAGGAAAYC
ncbi:MAG: RNA-directed DNA polymerase [Clostridiales bacterium]|nr:RNA-directed DNA polymerase [Clostridiales bacterium]